MPPIVTAATLARPERGQTTITFGGVFYRPMRPGPLPGKKKIPSGAPVIGGTNESELLRLLNHSLQQGDNARITYDQLADNDDDSTLPLERRSFTREQKLCTLKYLDETWVPETATKPAHLITIYQASKRLNISETQLRKWRRTRQGIANQKKGTRRNRDPRTAMGREGDMELELYEVFCATRKKGRLCDRRWFMRQARKIYRRLHPERIVDLEGGGHTYLKFRFSNAWFNGFRRRYDLSNRCKTKQAQKAPEELRATVQNWLQYNRRHTVIIPTSHLGTAPPAPSVGRFKLSEIANMDQTPLAFEFWDKHTYDFKGAKTVWVKESRSGWDKRQATLQVCVFADGVQRCRPQLIFHGAETGKHARARERLEYSSKVDVLFNPDAWASEKTILQWIKCTYRRATEYMSHYKEPRLLSLDAFRAHLTDNVRRELRKIHCTPSFIPGGCTGYVQVLDVALNQPLKALIKDAADRHYAANEERWEAGEWTKVRDRRVLLTHWVAEAWEELHVKYQETIVRTFRRVGLSLNPNGTEDGDIKIKGLEEMEVGDWRLQNNSFYSQEAEIDAEITKLNKKFDDQETRRENARLALQHSLDEEVVRANERAAMTVPIRQTAAQRRKAAAEAFFTWEEAEAGEALVTYSEDEVTTDSGGDTPSDFSDTAEEEEDE